LQQFTGTEQHFRHWSGRLLYTDGVKHMAERAGAYWLIDLVASYQSEHRDVWFQVWDLKAKDRAGVVTMRGDSEVLVKQELEYTDFPLESLRVFVADGVLLLPSEY
jgi:hypothetical protein